MRQFRPRLFPKTFTFTLDSLNILNTRSKKTDTDYASFTLRVNPQGGQGSSMTITKPMGDLGDGIHAINIPFAKVAINATDQVIMNYFVVNSGHTDPTKVESTLKQAGEQLSATGQVVEGLEHFNAIAVTLGMMKAITSMLSAVFGGLFGGQNCDGTVAVEQELVPWADLQGAGSGALTHTTVHQGSNSPEGCGKNSVYEVTWHAKQDVVTPVVVEGKA